MHLYRMPRQLRLAYRTERDHATRAFTQGDRPLGWHHLERAHVLAQPYAIGHTGSHLAMLSQGIAERDRTEVFGQIVRALLAAPGTVLGKAPEGNPGRARVPLRETRPVPSDLADLLASSRSRP